MPLESTLIPFGLYLIDKLKDKGFDHVFDRLSNIDQKDKFYDIVRITSHKLSEKYPDILGGSVNHFFQKDEIFNELIKLIFFDSKIDIEAINSQFDIKTLPSEFVSEFIQQLKTNLLNSNDFRPILVDKQIYVTCLGISSDIDSLLTITDLGRLELESIRKLLEQKFLTKFDLNKFKRTYFSNLEHNLSQVNMIGLGVDMAIKKGRKKKIDEIFVEPIFIINTSHISKLEEVFQSDVTMNENRIYYEYLFKLPKNIVVIGNPGSGKSFFLKSMICAIINDEKEKFANEFIPDKIPFRIELRKYLAFKKSSSQNIIAYLSQLLESEYGISGVLEESLNEIITYNETLFLFDGLDEIFDTQDKIDVKNDIENFIRSNPKTSSITTSRIEGYEEAVFDQDNFIELTIDKFNDDQIQEYVYNWYAVEDQDGNASNDEIADFFEKKDALDEELLRNPLLLSLIVILYRNNLKLPESKLEIYKSCTSTLVDKWDQTKDLIVDLDKEILKRKETILAELAYWQYLELSMPKHKITYERAKNVVGKCLVDKLSLADEFTVEVQAEKFMTYVNRRSIYFDNNFTHKTFLEYYTAYWIYTNVEKKHKKTQRDSIIKEYINNTFWHIVLELLINLIDKDQADNEIIDEIVDDQIATSDEATNFFLSVIPSIQNISLKSVEKVLDTSISFFMHFDGAKKPRFSSEFLKLSKYVNYESYSKTFFHCLSKCESKIYSDEERTIYLIFVLELTVESSGDRNRAELVELVSKNYTSTLASRNELLYKLCYFVLWRDAEQKEWKDYLREYVDCFGIKRSFSSTDTLFSESTYVSFFSICFLQVFRQEHIRSIEENIRFIFGLGYSLDSILNFLESELYFARINNLKLSEIDDVLSNGISIESEILLMLFLLNAARRARLFDNNAKFEEIKNGRFQRMFAQLKSDTKTIAIVKGEYEIK